MFLSPPRRLGALRLWMASSSPQAEESVSQGSTRLASSEVDLTTHGYRPEEIS